MLSFRAKTSYPHEVQTISPKHSCTPAEFSDKTWTLVTEDQFCHFPSLLCFEDGPLHIDPLWRLFVIPWTITVKPGAALFPTCSSSQRGFRHTISHGYSIITDAAVSDLQSPNQHPVYLQTLSVIYNFSHIERIEQSLLTNCQTSIMFNPLMWLSSIICLLHHDTLVIESHLWSLRSDHNRRLNKLHTISFIPYSLRPRRTVHIWYSTRAFQPFFWEAQEE